MKNTLLLDDGHTTLTLREDGLRRDLIRTVKDDLHPHLNQTIMLTLNYDNGKPPTKGNCYSFSVPDIEYIVAGILELKNQLNAVGVKT